MALDLAVKLANEGVPVQAIARAIGIPSAEVRERLVAAQLNGELVGLPCNDWSGTVRQPAYIVVNNKPTLEMAARRVFRLAPMAARMLLLLLQFSEVTHDRLLELSGKADINSLKVQMCRLRARLREFDVEIHTLYGHGYSMTAAQQRAVLKLLS